MGEWLRSQGHDVVDSRDFGDDPGDWALLARAGAEDRILVTLDTDFAALIYVQAAPQAGLVRLPDVPADQRIALMAEVLERHRRALETRAVVTVRENRSVSPGRLRDSPGELAWTPVSITRLLNAGFTRQCRSTASS